MKRTKIALLAIKNLFRYKRRTLITGAAIAFGLMMFIWVDSFLEGATDESVRNLHRYETGVAAAVIPGYFDDRETEPLGMAFPWDDLAMTLEARGVESAPRITFLADLVFFKDPFPEDGNIPARIIAIDPVLDSLVFSLEDTLAEGTWLSQGVDGAVLGRWLADAIGAKVGAPLIAVTTTKDGYAQTIDLEVVGIIDCPNPMTNREGFFINLETADTYLEMGGMVTSLHLDVPPSAVNRRRPHPAVALVENAGLEFASWQIQAADYVAVMEAEYGGSSMIIFLILIIAAVGISNTMLMAVFERSREIGMMRALGMTDGNVRKLFLWESAGIGFVGSLMGIGLGALVNVFLVQYGLDFSMWMQDANFGYRTSGEFYGAWHLQGYVLALALGIGLSVLVAAVSTRKILRMDIPSALRFS